MTASNTHIIVIGAGYAGLLAAIRLAGKTRRQKVAITLVNASDVFVERLRLHEAAANQPIKRRLITDTIRGTGINFVQGFVTGIDLTHHQITVETPSGAKQMSNDKLLYALGSTIERDSIPGVREYAYTLTPSGERAVPALREKLLGLTSGARVAVVGGGATGIEAAAEFASTYPQLKVRLVTRGSLGLFRGQAVADTMRKTLETWGVMIQDHTTITEVKADQIITEDGKHIPFDVCLWTGGFTVPTLAREAGLKVNEIGQILIDPYMRSVSHPDVYAVGDAAYPVEEPSVHVRMSAITAVILGAHGADSLAASLKGKIPKPLSFAYMGQGIALGRHKGIGYGSTALDVPKAPFFTGRLGYEIREMFVCLLAALPSIERRIPGFFTWLGKGRYATMKRQAAQHGQMEKAS
jgi:NADH dehydrogenase